MWFNWWLKIFFLTSLVFDFLLKNLSVNVITLFQPEIDSSFAATAEVNSKEFASTRVDILRQNYANSDYTAPFAFLSPHNQKFQISRN